MATTTSSCPSMNVGYQNVDSDATKLSASAPTGVWVR